MGKFYPVEVRERAVAAAVVGEMPRDEVARLFAVGIATLDRWLFLWRSGQDLVANLGRPGPARRWDEAALARLQRQVTATPDARLGDHVQAWKQAGGQALSETTLWRGLRLLGWTRKKALRQRRARRGRAGGVAGRARRARPQPACQRGRERQQRGHEPALRLGSAGSARR